MLTVIRISDWTIIRMIVLIALALMVLVIIWAVTTPPTMARLYDVTDKYWYYSCRQNGDGDSIFVSPVMMLFLTVMIIIAGWGVRLAWQTRQLPSAFNESSQLSMSIYNLCICGAILFPICLVMSQSDMPSIAVLICMLVCCLVVRVQFTVLSISLNALCVFILAAATISVHFIILSSLLILFCSEVAHA